MGEINYKRYRIKVAKGKYWSPQYYKFPFWRPLTSYGTIAASIEASKLTSREYAVDAIKNHIELHKKAEITYEPFTKLDLMP